MSRPTLLTAAVLVLAAMLAGPVAGQEIVRPDTGDSVVALASGLVGTPDGSRGLLFEFRPFVPLSDTASLRRIAKALFSLRRSTIDSMGVPYVALRATDRPPMQNNSKVFFQAYGFVLERRGDAQWYFLHETERVSDP
ncbi:MAG: hypothetical protein M3Z54_13755 [Gemmatimonadota bacterium]|nr:hypothetical protein [Gemmatimonadota bacterium]